MSLIEWFAEQTVALQDILQSTESHDLQRGTTAFLLLALKDEKGKVLVESLWEDPTFSGARAVVEELLQAVSPADGEPDAKKSP